MMKKILLVLVVLIAVFAVVAYIQPEDFTIERSAVVPATPAAVFPLVNDFHRWNEWSPFEKIDPQMTRTHSGAQSGKGAAYAWSGNSQAGEGDMLITESKPNELIRIDLNFKKPMAANNVAEFTFVPEGNGTKVTWKMSGKNNFVGKAMHLLTIPERMVGPMFEEGLGNLRAKVAAPPATTSESGTAASGGTALPSPTTVGTGS